MWKEKHLAQGVGKEDLKERERERERGNCYSSNALQ